MEELNSNAESWMEQFFAAPSFLDGIDPTLLAFGGSGMIVLFLWTWSKRLQMEGFWRILVLIMVYVLSIGTGIALLELGYVGNRTSAFMAGFWLPLLYSLIGMVVLKRLANGNGNLSNYDHLIDS